jgi:hypothetical protein
VVTDTPTPSSLAISANLAQIDEALKEAFPGSYGLDPDAELLPEDINGDGVLDQVARYKNGEVYEAIIRADISGDGGPDLIVQSARGVYIFVASGGLLLQPFGLETRWSRALPAEIQVRLVDYTGDGVPEAVIDDSAWGGGTGLWTYDTRESIVHCNSEACSLVWQDFVDEEIQDYNWGGYRQERAKVSAVNNANAGATLRVLREGFSLYCCAMIDAVAASPSELEVYPTTLTSFSWSGAQFDQVAEETVALGKTVRSMGPVAAIGPSGEIAGISWKDNMALGDENEYCRLYVGSAWIGDYFGCRHSFTSVTWQDVTGDQIDDIVIKTYSAGYPYGPDDLLSDETCMHQRLIVYQKTGSGYVQVANIAGCVIRNDLFGVALQDNDGDGIPEIIAAPVVTERGIQPAKEYRWDGEKFSLWTTLPDPDPADYHWIH